MKDLKISINRKSNKLLKKVNYMLVLNLLHKKSKDMHMLKIIHLKLSVQIYLLKSPVKSYSNILTHLSQHQIPKWPFLPQ